MSDALTILGVHVSRQQGQSLLHVGQELRLKAGPDFLQSVNEPGHFVGSDPTIQRKPIEPSHFPRTPASVSSAIALRGGSTSAFGFWVNDIQPVHWGVNSV